MTDVCTTINLNKTISLIIQLSDLIKDKFIGIKYF